jgi:hypothetical protein|nr:MAG TPA: Carboxypeptidase regulatory-like domain protein [Caudoviricetes sp.]
MRKIGLFNIGKLGLVKSAGTGKTDINKVIEKWIPKHMVFWYDMSKPVDVYVPGVTYANSFVNGGGGKLTYDKTINKCIITHTPTNNNNIAFWQIIVKPLQYVESYKIRVTGLPTGFTIKGRLGYDDIQITSDGEYDIPEYRNSSTTNTSYPGFYLAGDNVNDVDCNIVVEEIPTKQSVPTNEILKANPYLQDFSGNNRPLKLNNFLFAAMSGVGGYDISSTNILPDRANVTVTDNRIIHITKKLSTTDDMVNIVPSNSNPTHKFKVTGLSDGRQVSLVNRNGGFYTFDNGEHEVTLTYPEGTTSLYNAIGVTGDIGDMDVTIEFLPKYPNALITDGVDDYGVVENLQQGVKVLFVTINPFIGGKFIYDQRLNTTKPWLFAVFNDKGSIAYNSRNSNGKTYIDGTLNESTRVPALLNKKQIITIVNNDVTGDKTKTPIFFSNTDHNSGWISSAFYNSIGFDSVPTKQNDGFTEQDLIDYYIPKSIVTITVVDVNGAPIENATVTIEGLQYNTLSDGTVKVVGIANSTMSISVTKDGYMPYSNNEWKFANSRIILEVINNIIIMEDGNNILLENNNLILTED